jgi:hypothetical protein
VTTTAKAAGADVAMGADDGVATGTMTEWFEFDSVLTGVDVGC